MRVLQQIKELDDLPGRYVLLVVYGCRMEQERMGAGFAAVKKDRAALAKLALALSASQELGREELARKLQCLKSSDLLEFTSGPAITCNCS